MLADSIQLQPVLLKKLCRERPLLAQKSKQHVLDSNVPVAQAFRFFCGVSQNSLGFVAQWKVDGSWQLRLSLIAYSGFRLDLLANRQRLLWLMKSSRRPASSRTSPSSRC